MAGARLPDPPDTDRRRYYRIEDQVFVGYEIITGDEENPPSRFALISELSRHSPGPVSLPEDLSQRTPELGRYLRSVERRLADITRLVMAHEIDRSAARVRDVSISGGGLAFCARERLPVATRLRLELFMAPTCTALALTARVVRCELRPRQTAHPHWIAVEFEPLHDRDRDRLIKHILSRQAHQLRRNRRAGAPGA